MTTETAAESIRDAIGKPISKESERPAEKVPGDNMRINIDKLVTYLGSSHGFSADFETLPIPWWHSDWKALSIAFCVDGEHAFVVPICHPESNLTSKDIRYFTE